MRAEADLWKSKGRPGAREGPKEPQTAQAAQHRAKSAPCHSCLHNDGSARMSDPDLNTASARDHSDAG